MTGPRSPKKRTTYCPGVGACFQATKGNLAPCTKSRRRRRGWCHGIRGPTFVKWCTYIRAAGSGRPCRGRARAERRPRAYGGTPGSPLYVEGVRRLNIRGCVGESGGSPILVPRMVTGGLSSVFRIERRWLRPGRVWTGGWNRVNLQTLDGHRDVVCGDVEGGAI